MYISTIELDKGVRPAEGTQMYSKINPPMCFSDKLNWGITSDCVCNKVLRQRVSGRHIDCVDLGSLHILGNMYQWNYFAFISVCVLSS